MFPISILWISFLFFFSNVLATTNKPILFIVSYDAFRYNFISKVHTPTLSKLQEEGCTADYLENTFITKTFPNHMSLATGLYTESHGVMGNSIYDPILKRKLNYSYELWHYNEDVRPIWIENELKGSGRHSGVMMWPGGEYNYSGVYPTWHQSWTQSLNWQQRVDTALSWVQHPEKPANLIMLYIEEPDSRSHIFGPESSQVERIIESVDQITKYLLDRLDALDLKSRTDLFFVSDHGMQSVKVSDIIDLRKFVDETLYDQYEGSPTLHIVPKPGKAVEVYNKLQSAVSTVGGFHVYRPSDLLPRWHYLNSRSPPLLLLADPPRAFNDVYKLIEIYKKSFNQTVTPNTTFGLHGYDNQVSNMRPFFVAIGPRIRSKTRVSPFRTIDLYAIWAQLLGFPEAVSRTNSSTEPVRLVLRPGSVVSAASIAAIFLGVGLVLAAMLLTVYLAHRRLRNKYYTLLQTEEGTSDSRQRLLESEEEA